MVVRSSRRLTIKLPDAYPYFDRFTRARQHLRHLHAII